MEDTTMTGCPQVVWGHTNGAHVDRNPGLSHRSLDASFDRRVPQLLNSFLQEDYRSIIGFMKSHADHHFILQLPDPTIPKTQLNL